MRRINVALFFTIERRADGYYFQQHGYEDWEGPFSTYGHLAQELSFLIEEGIGLLFTTRA